MEESNHQPNEPQQPESQPGESTNASKSQPDVMTGWWRAVYLTLAAVFFVLGVIGALVPGIPATPFLLLTSYFLLRSSPRLNERLLNSRLVGPILRDWQHRGGVRKSVKWKAIVFVLLALSTTVYLASYSAIWIAAIIVAAAIGIAVILKLPTI